MGYRSQVRIAVSEEIYKKVIPQLRVLGVDFPTFLTNATIDQADGAYIYCLNDIKWYSTYPEVIAITAWINTLDNDDFQFLRTGEDATDIEEYGELCCMYVSNNIEYF